MDDVKIITADQAKVVAKQLVPIENYLSELVIRIRGLGYDDKSPLLDCAVMAATRAGFLRITFEEMFDPEQGEQNRINAATPKQRIKKFEYGDT